MFERIKEIPDYSVIDAESQLFRMHVAMSKNNWFGNDLVKMESYESNYGVVYRLLYTEKESCITFMSVQVPDSAPFDEVIVFLNSIALRASLINSIRKAPIFKFIMQSSEYNHVAVEMLDEKLFGYLEQNLELFDHNMVIGDTSKVCLDYSLPLEYKIKSLSEKHVPIIAANWMEDESHLLVSFTRMNLIQLPG